MPSIINSDDGVVSGSSGLKTSGGNDGILALQNNGTTNVTVTAAGNVGIGTSSPTARVHVSAPDGTAPLTLNTAGGSDSTRALNFNVAGDNYGKILVPSGSGGAMAFWTGGANAAAEQARITSAGLFQFNSGYGSVATAYGCRAWVNFNGTGTVAIRASGNVSSITDRGTGEYTINLSTAMPDATYATVGIGGSSTTVNGVTFEAPVRTAQTTSAVQCGIINHTGTFVDVDYISASIFR
jgi:hypothetical protein